MKIIFAILISLVILACSFFIAKASADKGVVFIWSMGICGASISAMVWDLFERG